MNKIQASALCCPSYKITINRKNCFDRLIEAGVKINSDVERNFFPFGRRREKEITINLVSGLVPIHQKLSFKHVLHRLKERGYRPGGIRELVSLTLSEERPEIPWRAGIAALASSGRDSYSMISVPYLCESDDGRNTDRLDFHPIEHCFLHLWIFLAIPRR